MNWNRSEENWKQIRDGIKQEWSELADSQVDSIAGRRDELLEKIQENYGVGREDAERQVTVWEMSNEHLFADTAA
jgi:uncharacterized protein YjbJ (UPF0337 family)